MYGPGMGVLQTAEFNTEGSRAVLVAWTHVPFAFLKRMSAVCETTGPTSSVNMQVLSYRSA